MQVTFLGHCGFAVDTGAHLLLFDYCPRLKQRAAAPILAELTEGRDVVCFVSHSHEDHFCRDVFDIPGARFVLAEGVPAEKPALTVTGGRSYDLGDLRVTTYESTDLGVAFLVESGGKRIFHAGDLAWWHWEGEPDPWNPDMERAFLAQAEKLGREPIDLAFLTADQRLRGAWLWGFDRLMRQGNVARAVPMHFWNVRSIPGKVLSAPCTAPYRDKIVPLAVVGDSAEL